MSPHHRLTGQYLRHVWDGHLYLRISESSYPGRFYRPCQVCFSKEISSVFVTWSHSYSLFLFDRDHSERGLHYRLSRLGGFWPSECILKIPLRTCENQDKVSKSDYEIDVTVTSDLTWSYLDNNISKLYFHLFFTLLAAWFYIENRTSQNGWIFWVTNIN